jgi:large subunit ribosomal protein L17
MRHRKAGLKLSKSISHRQAIFKNMVTSLFKNERIRTTDVKAKELRRWADHIVTLAKRGDLHARRQVLAIIQEKDVVHKIFEEVSEKFGSRNGGYTRIVKVGHRPGDSAPISLVELITGAEGVRKKPAVKKEKVPAAAAVEKQPLAKPAVEKEPPDVPAESTAKAVAAEESQQEGVNASQEPAQGTEEVVTSSDDLQAESAHAAGPAESNAPQEASQTDKAPK